MGHGHLVQRVCALEKPGGVRGIRIHLLRQRRKLCEDASNHPHVCRAKGAVPDDGGGTNAGVGLTAEFSLRLTAILVSPLTIGGNSGQVKAKAAAGFPGARR